MKVLSILGSPHKQGNTDKVLGWVDDELREGSHEVERINLIEKNIGYCQACYHCQGYPDEPACVQDDDMQEIYDKMINTDAIILASPLYMWSFASPMKTMLDRCLALVTGYGSDAYKSLIDGKKTALLVTCAGPVENNADLLPQIYKRIMNYGKTHQIGELIVPLCTSPDALSDEIKGQAKQLANRIFVDI